MEEQEKSNSGSFFVVLASLFIFYTGKFLYNHGIAWYGVYNGTLLPIMIGLVFISLSIIMILRIEIKYKDLELHCIVAATFSFIFSVEAYLKNSYLSKIYDAAIVTEEIKDTTIESDPFFFPDKIAFIIPINNLVFISFLILGFILVGFCIYKNKKISDDDKTNTKTNDNEGPFNQNIL